MKGARESKRGLRGGGDRWLTDMWVGRREGAMAVGWE